MEGCGVLEQKAWVRERQRETEREREREGEISVPRHFVDSAQLLRYITVAYMFG